MQLTVVKNATCTFCGCVCDDIELHADGERITETKRACGDARKIDVDSSRNEAARIVTHAARRPGRMSGSTMAR